MPEEGTAQEDKAFDGSQGVLDQTLTSATSTSFIYPVRSLLTGIQPAADDPPSPVVDTTVKTSIRLKTYRPPTVTSSTPDQSINAGTSRDVGLGRVDLDYLGLSGENTTPTKVLKRRRPSPNFRDFRRDEDPLTPRLFSLLSPMSTEGSPALHPVIAGPAGEPVAYDVNTMSREGEWNSRHPAQVSEAAADAFSDSTDPGIALVPMQAEDEGLVSQFSRSGIVHLGPLPSEDLPAVQIQSLGSSVRSRDRSVPESVRPLAAPEPHDTSNEEQVVDLPSFRPSSPPSPMETDSAHTSSLTGSSDLPHVTFRYQHMEDENGHHLIVGREGVLTKCEDEPIRAPGAVQGYGVLIAVEEDDETGNLVVRQVSENATELLGLSPSYLFSLECFSHTLPQHQADQLFDNTAYLSDSTMSPEEQAENLHVFMLHGWGEPSSALPDEYTTDPQHRRQWSCWCAAHRPEPSPSDDPQNVDPSTRPSLIILEFELERDPFNPLYPPVLSDTSSSPSGVSSPSDGSAVASDSSGRTLVSHGSDERASSSEGVGLTSSGSDGDTNIASATVNSASTSSSGSRPSGSIDGDEYEWLPNREDILESTTSLSKPLLALERLRRNRRAPDSPSPSNEPGSYGTESHSAGRGASRASRGSRRGGGGVGMMDVFAVMAQINEQLGAATELDVFLKIAVGVIKDLTQFHRVLVYQFDEMWNGKVVAELVDWNRTHDLYHGLYFPATDIPPQARQLYALNKVRLLYDRGQPTARLVVRSKKDLDPPLNMTHCYLRAMSPIHIKYLGNMGVRASMSVSILAFGQLWGLVACHSYGNHGMRVSFPVRQMLRLLSQSISRNVERLSYAQRLHTRKLINTLPTDQHPSGYIISNADDLLGLFDADFGVLVIGEGAKLLGSQVHSQETLLVAEYLRLKQFPTMQVSQSISEDFPDLRRTSGLEVVAGLLYVPLSSGGRDFITFLRKGQPRQVKWAGRPLREGEVKTSLEPRSSFKIWSETVAGRSRLWTDEQLETAGVLALVYGKFIEVWRQKETAMQATKLTNILLSNASHEVRTPLNHIINYLELALNGQLDGETRENLSQSHAASKSLLFTINDLLDLTRLESGNETSFNEVFDLQQAVEDAIHLYRNESTRRGILFEVDTQSCPKYVVGDVRKIRTVVANLTANAVKYTEMGKVSVECRAFDETPGLRDSDGVAVEIVVSDTGCGIPSDKLESIFREFEQVEMDSSYTTPAANEGQGLGLGLAVVARIVEQLGGQLRVDSKVGQGSRFSFLIPFATEGDGSVSSFSSSKSQSASLSRSASHAGSNDEIDNLVRALSSTHVLSAPQYAQQAQSHHSNSTEFFEVENTDIPLAKPVLGLTTDTTDTSTVSSAKSSRKASSLKSLDDSKPNRSDISTVSSEKSSRKASSQKSLDDVKPSRTDASDTSSDHPSRKAISKSSHEGDLPTPLRILIVEDNDINRTILAKRLTLDGHTIVNTTNGQEGLEMVESDQEFDCVLMDIQMPLLNGYEATERIRAFEKEIEVPSSRLSQKLNGRLPIFAVSASLFEEQREDMFNLGMDGWILKPIDFKRLRLILKGVTDAVQREKDVYRPGRNWELGGWLTKPKEF